MQCWHTDYAVRKAGSLVENMTEVHSSSCPLLEQVTGTRWVGVKFLKYLPSSRGGIHFGAMRFCEAVCRAEQGCIDLSPERICCDGAKRAFAWTRNRDQALVRHLSEKTGMSEEAAQKLIRQVPVLGFPYAGIHVGQCANPDVLVTYVRPQAAMRLVRFWETATGRNLRMDVSSIMAVCGNAVVKAYMSQSISISFGCLDSRQYGGIRPEEMVIAIPAGLVDQTVNQSPMPRVE